MNFGRRAFLQFAAGAVGGTLLSPMPWQLAGDSARWSQNWSWRPSPERGEITKVPGACTLCEGGCAIQAHLVNGNRAIFIEGNPANPLTRGGICALGASGLQFLYAPYRIAQPMKQTKSRGDTSGFQPSHGMTPWPSLRKSWASCALRANRMRSHASLLTDPAAWMICGFSFSRHMVLLICSGCRRRPMVSGWLLS